MKKALVELFTNFVCQGNSICCCFSPLPNANKIPNRTTKQDRVVAKLLQQLSYDGINFPVTVKQYSKIEKENNIRINVFGYENKQKFPIYVSKEQFDKTLNLLFITEGNNKHYVLIKDFNEFMRNQTKHNEKKKTFMHVLSPVFHDRGIGNTQQGQGKLYRYHWRAGHKDASNRRNSQVSKVS